MWCWRRMEKISWTDHVRNEDVLLRVKEHRNIVNIYLIYIVKNIYIIYIAKKISKRKANWIGHTLRRNCLLQGDIEGKIKGWIEVTGR
jgi:hypothetical protein